MSPSLIFTMSLMASSVILMCSAWQICMRRPEASSFEICRNLKRVVLDCSAGITLETCVSRGYVVADHAEAGGLGVLLHDAPQRRLGVSRHGIGLVEDDEFHVVFRAVEVHLRLREGLDDLTHHIDAARVRGVELGQRSAPRGPSCCSSCRTSSSRRRRSSRFCLCPAARRRAGSADSSR